MRLIPLVVLLLLALPTVSAYTIEKYSADYDLRGDDALVTILLTLSEKTSGFSLMIPYDAAQISTGTSNYSLEQYSKTQKLTLNDPTDTIEITYLTESLVDNAGDYYFLLDLSSIDAKERSVLLKLPEDAKLKYPLISEKPSIIPKTDDVATDGRRIIIHWSEPDFDRSEAVMVIYEMPSEYVAWLLAIFIITLLFAAGVAYIYYFKMRKWVEISQPREEKPKHPAPKKESQEDRLKKDLTRNLFEDEKLIVETLLEADKNELWQKQLELRTKIPKVRLSRKLRSLEAKGLVEKVPYGNTNHIRLKLN